jgi:hypothetical protein
VVDKLAEALGALVVALRQASRMVRKRSDSPCKTSNVSHCISLSPYLIDVIVISVFCPR